MSVSASIEIQFTHINSIDIVLLLLNSGWTFEDNGHQSYIPIGDNDEWDWRWEHLKNNELLDILKIKQNLREVIGVGITWKDSERGGELILNNDNSLILNLTNNRLVSKSTVTDFDWYLEKIVNVFNSNAIFIESIKCYEYK
nr:hypothetical protein [Acinetobacter sp. Marseille-Q1620]